MTTTGDTPASADPSTAPAPKRRRPPRLFEPTREQRTIVSVLVACGLDQDSIADRIINPQTNRPIEAKTLRRAFREEIDKAKVTANSAVAQSLFKKATGDGKNAVTAAIFWLKTQAGWKETTVIDQNVRVYEVPM